MKQHFHIAVLAIMIMAILFTNQMFGQYPIEGFRLGVEGGVLRGHTDKHDDKLSQDIRFFLRHDIVAHLDGDFAVSYGGIMGTDYQADLYTADYKLLYKPPIFKPSVVPYVGAGVGLAHYFANHWTRSPLFDKSDYIEYVPVIAGIEFAVTDHLQFDINVSGNYSTSNKIETNQHNNTEGSGYNDGWWGAFAGVSYTLWGGNATKEKAELRARELALAEARRIQDSLKVVAEAKRMQDSINAMAEALRLKEAKVAEALRIQDSIKAAALAQHIKDSLDNVAALKLALESNKPVALKTEVGKAIILEGVVFKTGSTVITVASNAILNSAKKTLEENPEITVQIQGFTDNVGSAKSNLKLSLKRAQAVKAWLVKNGIAASRITAEGYGDTNPRGDNKTADGRQLNRRIEFFRTK
jgi:outer membrane protein OmpA-like peptidoglycan-associated protein